MAYAQGTEVSVERSQIELQQVLRKYGATGYATGWTEQAGIVQFAAEGRQIKFIVPMPQAGDEGIRLTKQRIVRTPAQVKTALAAEERRRWRALLLVIKAKLEAVESGIVTFEEEFLAHVVMPDGLTVLQHVQQPIERAYVEGHVRPLLGLEA
jgi:hypothetical protein